MDAVIKADEAKKKKLQIPQPLNMKNDKPKEPLVNFLTAEMIAAEEAKTKEAAASKGQSAA